MDAYKFINCTPHDIVLCGTVIKCSGVVPRCDVVERAPHFGPRELAGVPLVVDTLGGVKGLPEPEHETGYIVSRMVFDRIKLERDDVFCLTHFERDGEGRIVGAGALVASPAFEDVFAEMDLDGDGFRP